MAEKICCHNGNGTEPVHGSQWTSPPLERPGRPVGREAVVAEDLLANLDRPEAVIEQVAVGPYFLAVVSGNRVGLAHRLNAEPGPDEVGLAEKQVGRTIREAAELFLVETPYAICLGLAAVNAGLNAEAEPAEYPAEEIIAELGKGEEVVQVGYFPFTEALSQRVGKLHLFEMRDAPGRTPRDQWETVLGRVKVLAVTGTTLMTRHLAYFLDRAPQAHKIVLGPSTPLTPALFKHGVDVLAGSVVTDAESILKRIRDGQHFQSIKEGGGVHFARMMRPGWLK